MLHLGSISPLALRTDAISSRFMDDGNDLHTGVLLDTRMAMHVWAGWIGVRAHIIVKSIQWNGSVSTVRPKIRSEQGGKHGMLGVPVHDGEPSHRMAAGDAQHCCWMACMIYLLHKLLELGL